MGKDLLACLGCSIWLGVDIGVPIFLGLITYNSPFHWIFWQKVRLPVSVVVGIATLIGTFALSYIALTIIDALLGENPKLKGTA